MLEDQLHSFEGNVGKIRSIDVSSERGVLASGCEDVSFRTGVKCRAHCACMQCRQSLEASREQITHSL